MTVSRVLFSSKNPCYSCGTENSLECGKQHWYHNHDMEQNRLCKKCYDKLIHNKSFKHKLAKRNWTKKTIFYKGVRIAVRKIVRLGICKKCGKTDCKTELHHIQYHDDDPMKDTIELCSSCHGKEGIKSGNGFQKGNQFWKNRKRHGRFKSIILI